MLPLLLHEACRTAAASPTILSVPRTPCRACPPQREASYQGFGFALPQPEPKLRRVEVAPPSPCASDDDLPELSSGPEAEGGDASGCKYRGVSKRRCGGLAKQQATAMI